MLLSLSCRGPEPVDVRPVKSVVLCLTCNYIPSCRLSPPNDRIIVVFGNSVKGCEQLATIIMQPLHDRESQPLSRAHDTSYTSIGFTRNVGQH